MIHDYGTLRLLSKANGILGLVKERRLHRIIINALFLMSHMKQRTYIVVVRVAREGVASLLGGRLLALRLEGRCGRIGVALELVTDVLGGRLLRVGLEGGTGLVGEALTTS